MLDWAKMVAVADTDITPGADHLAQVQRSRLLYIGEIVVAFVAALIFYVALYGEMPYHDVERFRLQVESGRFVWDIGHIFLQPATLLWHRYLGFGETAVASQRHINTFATALAVAIFHALLLRLQIPPWQRIAATALLAGSGSIITLAPTGHMKLLAFPFVNGALYLGVVWERACARRTAPPARLWLGCAALLGLGASFLASVLATGPFATLAVLVVSRRSGDAWLTALRRASIFGAVALLLFLALACFGFIAFSGQPVSIDGLRASVQAKADIKPPNYGLLLDLFRLGFGTVNNITAAPALASVGRAALAGRVHSLAPFYRVLAEQSLPWLLTLVLLALIYVRSVWACLRGAACVVPLTFLAGAQAWTIYYGLDDPEHWFQLTAPTLLLFVLLFPRIMPVWCLPTWSVLAVAANLAFVAVPVASYPLDRYQAEMQARFTPRDLVIAFAAFPGRPYGGVFDLPGVPQLKPDLLLQQFPDTAAFFLAMQQQIDAAVARGGRVVVFDILDQDAWDAPWPALERRGITKPVLFGFFTSHYDVQPLGSMAELKAWELRPRNVQSGGMTR